jgi:sugar phosphate isomerase/epimerase
MQSLLFGVKDASLFGGAEAAAAFEAGMRRAIDLAERLGIGNLVVGSPKNRVIPDSMSRETAWTHAAEVFRRLGDYADWHGCVLAMEPNPAVYGTNFLNSLVEADQFVRQTDHPAVTLNFDVGSIHLNGEFDSLPRLLANTIERVSHIHVSQPQLALITPEVETLAPLFSALRSAGWEGWVSIEMRKAPSDPVGDVRRAVECCLATMAGH